MPRGFGRQGVVQTPVEVGVEDRPSKLNRSNRPTRGAIHGKRNKITVTGTEAGFHYCWVNDDNVERFLEDGYEFVTHDVRVGDKAINKDSQIGGKVSKNMGNSVTAYLMRCTEEIYKEICDMLNQEVDDTEQTMRGKKDGALVGQINIGRGEENL